MPRLFSTGLTVSGIRVESSVPKHSIAWMKANSLFYPVGPGYSEAWLVLSGENNDLLTADDLRNSSHTIKWTTVTQPDNGNPSSVTKSFPGWYYLHSERVLQGGPNQSGALFLARFVDVRYLRLQNSDTGNIKANIRSYAQVAEYLTGAGTYSWATLVEELWDAVGGLGGFPGLPAGLPIDSTPQNSFFIGLNGIAALNAVLDQLDCALAPIPTEGTFTIVQLGEAQALPNNLPIPQQNFEPIRSNVHCAETLKFYFHRYYKNYGQEKDTELSDNWTITGNHASSSAATNINGAIGTKPLWDDMPYVINLDGSDGNTVARATRMTNRVSRYVTRNTCDTYHRIYSGINTQVNPGGTIKAIMFRNWDDGVDDDGVLLNPYGGTVTEWIAKVDFVGNQNEFLNNQLITEPIKQQSVFDTYMSADLGRKSYPNYPRLSQVVRIEASGGYSAGALVSPNADGFHAGNVYRMVNGVMTQLEFCWILLLDMYGDNAGQVKGVQHQYYLGRLMGQKDSGGIQRPLYVVQQVYPRGLAIATLSYDMCGVLTDVDIYDFQMLDGSIIDPIPTIANNEHFKHLGRQYDKVLLTWSDLDEAWIVIDVTKHTFNVMVGIRRDGDCEEFGCVERQTVTAALEVCGDPVWTTAYCIPPCVDTSFQTSNEQTSFEQTSNMQTSTVGCGDGIINPDIYAAGQILIATGPAGSKTRRVSITVTDQSGCGSEFPGWETKTPRENDTIWPFGATDYSGTMMNLSAYDPGDPGYQQGTYDTYTIRCTQRFDIISGVIINPDDPNDVEWVMEGEFSVPTLGLGSGGSWMRVSETQGGASTGPDGSGGYSAMAGTLTILSFNPFHARCVFTPNGWYPTEFGEPNLCGAVEVEFIEL